MNRKKVSIFKYGKIYDEARKAKNAEINEASQKKTAITVIILIKLKSKNMGLFPYLVLGFALHLYLAKSPQIAENSIGRRKIITII